MEAPTFILALLLTQADPASPVDAALEEGRALALEGSWARAATVLTPVVDPERSDADPLVLLTRAVLEAGDLRRARLLSERGLLRFPEDLRFRRLDLAVLIERRAYAEAAAAARSVLSEVPEDRIAWRQLAAASLEAFDEAEQRAVLEAAHLALPDDPVVFERHLRAQLMAGHHEEAAALAQEALTKPKLRTNPAFVPLAVRAAEAARAFDLARTWLATVPADARDDRLSMLEARVALAAEDPQTAEAALVRLIERGTATPGILMRAGRLAEEREALGRAEAFYAQAAEGEGDAARLARLTLARFLAKIGHHQRAQTILRGYLTKHPSDAYARQLARVIDATLR